MRCKLVFEDWRQIDSPESVYNSELGIELAMGDMHSGTVFEADVRLTPDLEEEIAKAFDAHKAYPVFKMLPPGF